MDKEKCRCLTKAFRTLRNRINKINERELRLVYQKNVLSFTNLIEQDNPVTPVTIHQRNLQILVTEILKLRKDLAPDKMKEVSYSG